MKSRLGIFIPASHLGPNTPPIDNEPLKHVVIDLPDLDTVLANCSHTLFANDENKNQTINKIISSIHNLPK